MNILPEFSVPATVRVNKHIKEKKHKEEANLFTVNSWAIDKKSIRGDKEDRLLCNKKQKVGAVSHVQFFCDTCLGSSISRGNFLF